MYNSDDQPYKLHKVMCFKDDMMFIKSWIFKRKNLKQRKYFNNDGLSPNFRVKLPINTWSSKPFKKMHRKSNISMKLEPFEEM